MGLGRQRGNDSCYVVKRPRKGCRVAGEEEKLSCRIEVKRRERKNNKGRWKLLLKV